MGDITFGDLIGNIGVPAAVCFGVMHWFRADLKDLTAAIKDLTKVIAERLDTVEKGIVELRHEVDLLKRERGDKA